MSNQTHQKQQEQARLLQSSDRSQFITSDVKLISSQKDKQSSIQTQKDQNHSQFDQSEAIRIAQSVGDKKQVYQTYLNKIKGCEQKIILDNFIKPTSSQPILELQQNVESDYQRELRLMDEEDELKFQEWKRQRQILFRQKIKKMREQAQLRRLLQKQERQKRIAMNTWSDQIGFFQNIKRFLGIAQRNDKKNK